HSLLGVANANTLGPFSTHDLERIADRVEQGALNVAPVLRDTICDTHARGNWGDPLDRGSPCALYFPLIFAPGDLSFAGTGQGVLVVVGNLLLQDNAQFYGPV